MRLQNNLLGVNTHRQLGINAQLGAKSIEKLSSGYRINRAGDDAAGLAISEKMRAQVRGLNQASRNAQDGISLIQTVEGAMNETHEMLQRIRQLAVQASSDTNIDVDRGQINTEISQLKVEIDRVANNTEFNTLKVMNYGAKFNAAGFEGISESAINTLNEKIPGWINDAMSLLKDNFDIDHPDAPTKRPMNVVYVSDSSAGFAASMSTSTSTAASLTLTINLANVTDSSGELIDEQLLDGLLAHEIMHAYQYTELTELIQDGTMTDEETWLMEGLAMAIQGGNGWISQITGGITNADISGAFGNTHADYASAFVAIKTLHEITVGGIDSIIDRLELGDTLDEAIENTTQQDQGEVTSAGTYEHSNYGGGDTGYHSWAEFATDFNAGDFDNYLNTSTDFSLGTGAIIDASTAGSSSNLSYADTIPNATGTALVNTHFSLDFSTNSSFQSDTPEFILFHIGANEGQNLRLNSFDLTANGLGLDSVNVSTQLTADESITLIDSAISQVSERRSELGAIQNRLEHTIKSLDNSSENLQASESRIRDVDMAKEMMSFTKMNILQQAAQAMMVQANQQPQGVLQLLR